MLNSVLTVERGRAGSHQGKGWELFTDAYSGPLIDDLAGGISVMGAQAQRKGATIDTAAIACWLLRIPRHYLLTGDSWGAGISVRPIASSWSIIAARGLVLFFVTAHY
ncbi:MAG: hypothetical protein CM15mP84_06610 [Cellvibrionales bacterium]|nr:MAG: hypothetical protein CM15mP84_06610 [Cellvibrionales bacterium]